MLDVVRSALAFLLVLGVLVFVHEMGHYLAARWRGVHVEAFSIGFGQPITSWTDRLGTVWKLSWIPLGGYVKLHGQERPEDVSDEVRASWLPGRTFQEKSVLSRAIVVAAGPIANFILAILVFALLFGIVGRSPVIPVIDGILPDKAASRSTLQKNDRILSIDGAPIERFEDIRTIVSANPGQALTLHVLRAGQEQDVTVVPDTQTHWLGRDTGSLGVSGAVGPPERLGPVQALTAGATQTWGVIAATFQGLGQMITGQRGSEELGGPLRIAQMSGQVAKLGIVSLVGFIALLSVNLGLINLFPIPVLDGGHLVFFAAEALRGRPLPPRAQELGFRAGLAVLASLFVFATWNDLTHLGVFHWVSSLIG